MSLLYILRVLVNNFVEDSTLNESLQRVDRMKLCRSKVNHNPKTAIHIQCKCYLLYFSK